MSSQRNGQSVPYDVRLSANSKAQFKTLLAKAKQKGTSKQFLAAIREIVERLGRAPLAFGEPVYRLPVCVCACAKLP